MIGRLVAGCILGLTGLAHATQQDLPPYPSTIATLFSATAKAVTTDATGNIYIVGSAGRSFQTTPGALQRTCADTCNINAFLAKLDPRGRLLYATYVGVSSDAFVVAVDSQGNMYVARTTWSADFPAINAIVPARAEQQSFVVKVSAAGRLVFSTTLGGSGMRGLAVDDSGDVFVAGFASRDTVPMKNAIQPVRRGTGSENDAFVARLRTDGSGLVYSTYLGGSRSDSPSALAVQPDGSVVVVGQSSSPDFPSVRATKVGLTDSRDAFVARIASDGSVLEFSTLLGGAQLDDAMAVAIAPNGLIYVTGSTESPDFGVTDDALDAGCGTDGQCNMSRGSFRGIPTTTYRRDAFLVAFEQDGRRRFSSFMGGSQIDEPRAMGISSTGVLFVSAFSTSPELAPGIVPCATNLACPPLLFEISLTGPRLITQGRLPAVADYSPSFDYVPMAVGASGNVIIVANRSPYLAVMTRPQSSPIP